VLGVVIEDSGNFLSFNSMAGGVKFVLERMPIENVFVTVVDTEG